LTCRTISVPFGEVVRSASWIVAFSLPMAAIVYLARLALFGGSPAGLQLAVLVVLGIGTYVGLRMWRAPELVSELRDLVRRCGYAKKAVARSWSAGARCSEYS
jgi:hypothetical protein